MSLIRRNSDGLGEDASLRRRPREGALQGFSREARKFFLDHQQNFFKTQNPGGGAGENTKKKKKNEILSQAIS